MTSSQPSNKPIGRLPTSPRNNRATGLLKGAKPIIAPPSASAATVASRGSAPMIPKSTRPAVTGTTSATVIQSMPSMKFTRLTNQSKARPSSARSSQKGNGGTSRSSPGSATMTIVTAAACRNSRGRTAMVRTSSTAPTTATTTVAVRTSHRAELPMPPIRKEVPVTTTNVAAITAKPPPCGVGTLCDDRALGRASAWCWSTGCNSQINTMLISAEATNTSASPPIVVMLQPPQHDAGRNAAAVEARLDVDDDTLAAVQQWRDQRPAGLIGVMRDRQHHRIGGLQCLERCQLDTVFAARIGGVGHWIVHLHDDAGRGQFAHNVDDFRIADIRHVFLEGEAENGHAFGPPTAGFEQA